jgi:hypothetical protein
MFKAAVTQFTVPSAVCYKLKWQDNVLHDKLWLAQSIMRVLWLPQSKVWPHYLLMATQSTYWAYSSTALNGALRASSKAPLLHSISLVTGGTIGFTAPSGRAGTGESYDCKLKHTSSHHIELHMKFWMVFIYELICFLLGKTVFL